MTIFRTAFYAIRSEAMEACKACIQETVDYTKAHEPGTVMYIVLQEAEKPTRFVHISAYSDEAALQRHVTGEPMLSNIQKIIVPATVEPATFAHYRVMDAKIDGKLVAEETSQKEDQGGGRHIFRLAQYTMRPEALEAWEAVIHETIEDAKADEPGTLMYMVLQEAEKPTRFVHVAVYSDEEAMRRHVNGEAVTRKIREVLQPALVGPVTFTLYTLVDGKVDRSLVSE